MIPELFIRRFSRCLTRARTVVPLGSLIFSALGGPVIAQTPVESSVPPEELRFGNKEFREGLKQRGLSELLELHLADFPPSTESETLLLMRDMRLARYADPCRTVEERRAALSDANDLLGRLIEARPDDSRRFHWQIELAESLVLEEAELPAAAVLFQRGNDKDRTELARIAGAALTTLTELRDGIRSQYDRIDAMSLEELERADTEAMLESLDAASPRAEYLLLWARFYDAVTRDRTDAQRAEQLEAVAEHIAANSDWLAVPHEASGVQIQLLLLAGMTHRRLADFPRAAQYLDEVADVADRLNDPLERARLDTHLQLARFERIRTDADAGAYNEALRRISELYGSLPERGDQAFFYRLSAARLEREVLRRRADDARRQGRHDAAEIYEKQAWQSMQRLLQSNDGERDRILASVYQALPSDVDPERLDPFERCALVAGWLYEAGETPDKEASTQFLDRAVSLASRTLPLLKDHNAPLKPILLFNLAVAHFRLGQSEEAASRLLELAREFPDHSEARSALMLAVQMTARAMPEPGEPNRTALSSIYGAALKELIDRFPDAEAARYWRFHYAQWLEGQGRFQLAAEQYAAVPDDHEYALEAAYFRLRSLAMVVESTAESDDPDDVLGKKLGAFHDALQEFRQATARTAARSEQIDGRGHQGDLSIRADLVRAEVYVLPRVDRAAEARAILVNLDDKLAGREELIARRWQLQLRVHVTLGQYNDAAEALTHYVEADPEHAGPALQAIYDSMVGGFVERVVGTQAEFEIPAARGDLIVRLAEHIQSWTRRAPGATVDHRRLAAIQYAESLLLADRLTAAKERYESLMREAGNTTSADFTSLDAIDLRLRLGLAETAFRLGDHTTALRNYNPLAVSLSPEERLRWHALLRDLQCRTAMGSEPRDILKVVDQQRQLFPELGGPTFAERFAVLRRENEQRRSEKVSPAP